MWANELKRLRRLLRDPSSNIFSDAFLRHIYNQIQKDFSHKTRVLEDVVAQRVPQLYHYSYQFDWEYGYIPTKYSQIYQCLTQHDYSVICHRWEAQAITGIDSGVSDLGAHFTQPWEAYHLAPGEEVKMRFPQNMNFIKFIAYDESPIEVTTKKKVQGSDPSYLERTGEPYAYYPYDETDNSYVLYPRPSASFQSDIAGEGVAFYESDDTESDTTGIIAVRDDSTPSASIGGSVDVIDTVNNVFVVYDTEPTDMVSLDDEPDFPVFMRKYIRFGVCGRAFGSNTDGKDPRLADYWMQRYKIGVKFVQQYVRSRRQDRDYQRQTGRIPTRRATRLPRLPDGYPPI